MDLAKHLDSAYRAFGVTREEAGGLRSTRPEVVALELGQLGFRVFPAAGETKIPAIERWQFRASSDPRKIEAWYRRCKRPNRELNWLVLTGRDGGLWIIDIDGPQGREDLARLEAELGPLPQSPITESGRVGGGEHRWFRPTPGIDTELINQQHMFGLSIDVRGWHGYAVIPGSIHAETRLRYRWREGCAPDEM